MKKKAKRQPVDNKIELHLKEKRQELIWALSLQDYSLSHISRIFNNLHRATVKRVISRKPADWTPKWKKVQE